MVKKLTLITPRGFCFGVERALRMLDEKIHENPYVLHEIIHNSAVVDGYKARGVTFVERVSDVPGGACLFISAHGIGQKTKESALQKGRVIDTTCPFVLKVHKAVLDFEAEGRAVILLGEKGHAEVVGIMGQLKPETCLYIISNEQEVESLPDMDYVGVTTQTTLSIFESEKTIQKLKEKYPHAVFKTNICSATTERQQAVIDACKTHDVILVVGDPKSSNANRLVEVAKSLGKKAFLIENADALNSIPLNGNIAITAAASTPENLVQSIYDFLQKSNLPRP